MSERTLRNLPWPQTNAIKTSWDSSVPWLKPSRLGNAPDTFNFLREVMRAMLSVTPKCSHRCVSLKESPFKTCVNPEAHDQDVTRANLYENEMGLNISRFKLFRCIFIFPQNLCGNPCSMPLGPDKSSFPKFGDNHSFPCCAFRLEWAAACRDTLRQFVCTQQTLKTATIIRNEKLCFW